LQCRLTSFCTLSQRMKLAAVTSRTAARHWPLMTTVVAVKVARCLMQGNTGVAVIAVGQPAAVMALQSWCITSAVEKYQHLIVRADFSGNGSQCFRRETFNQGFCTNIQQLNLGFARIARALLQT